MAKRRRRRKKKGTRAKVARMIFGLGCSVFCHYCGVRLTPLSATEDHVVPLSNGGSDKHTNKVYACKPCNQAKGNMPVEEYLKIGVSHAQEQ